MPNKQDDSLMPETRHAAGDTDGFDHDTDEEMVRPKPRPEITEDDGDVEQKNADAALDDLEIEVDEREVRAESQSRPPGRKH
jgi:hypothetical protein